MFWGWTSLNIFVLLIWMDKRDKHVIRRPGKDAGWEVSPHAARYSPASEKVYFPEKVSKGLSLPLKVLRSMPRISAARDLFPSTLARTLRM